MDTAGDFEQPPKPPATTRRNPHKYRFWPYRFGTTIVISDNKEPEEKTMLEKFKKGIVAAVAIATAATVGSFGLASTANALDKNATGSITISNLADAGDTVDVTSKAYKIIDVNYDYDADQPESPEFTWNSAVAAWVKANYPEYIGKGNIVTDEYEGLPNVEGSTTSGIANNETTGDIAKFFDKLGSSNLLTKVAGSAKNNGDTVTIKGLALGGYYVEVTNNNASDSTANGLYVYRAVGANVLPKYVDKQWVVDNANIVAKRSKPGMDKSINEQRTSANINTGLNKHNEGSDTAAIGETVNFNLRTDVPAYPSNALDKKYWISDAMDKGLTFNNDVEVYGVKSTEAETKLTEGDAYTKTLNTKDMDNHDVTFLLKFDYDKIRSYAKIHVKYTATVNENAVVGKAIYNDAKLQYNNNPYRGDGYRTVDDKTKVYVFGIKVNKIEAGTKKALPGAEFKLERKGSNEAFLFVKLNDGVYRKATAAEIKNGKADGKLVVDAKGKLTVYGLKGADDAGKPLTYLLTETKAPAGYNKLAEPVEVVLDPVQDEKKDYTGAVEGNTEVGYTTKDVENKIGKLPKTGGIGTIVFSVLGALMIAGGVMLLISRKKA